MTGYSRLLQHAIDHSNAISTRYTQPRLIYTLLEKKKKHGAKYCHIVVGQWKIDNLHIHKDMLRDVAKYHTGGLFRI